MKRPGTGDPRDFYREAINHWAFSIKTDNGLQGMAMGRVFAYAEVIGRDANEIVADLREAQARLDGAEGPDTSRLHSGSMP